MKSLLIVSDPHSNSTVGLAKPLIQLDDGDTVHASTPRRWLFWVWEDILKKAQAKVQEYGSELYGLINGDAVETDAKGRSNQVISRNETTAVKIATDVFEPLFEMCKGVYVVRGTEAHVGAQAKAEEAFAANFDNTVTDTETGRASWQYLLLDVEGVKLDIAHHPKGGGSGRPMNRNAGVMRLASDALFEYADAGQALPDLLIRSHLHGYRDSYDAFKVRAIITPAMSLLTSYVHRLGINQSQPVGALMVTCWDKQYRVDKFLYDVQRPQWTTL